MSSENLRRLIRDAISESIELTTELHVCRTKPLTPDTRESELATATYLLGDFREALALADYRIADSRVSSILAQAGVELDKSSPTYKQLCRDYLEGAVSLLKHQQSLLNGHLLQPSENRASDAYGASKSLPQPKLETRKASELIDEFVAAKLQSRKVRQATLDDYKAAVADFEFVLGPKALGQVSYDDAVYFRETMKGLPKHRNTKKEYKDTDVQELLALDIPVEGLLSANTISQKLNTLSGYFNWLKARKYVKDNPFEGVTLQADPESYAVYIPDDLKDIFSSSLYVDSSYSRKRTTTASHWWMPLLALFTGARPSELVQMRLDDIREDKGILYASVVDDEEKGQRVKTKAGIRKFPIHPTLLGLGFEDYLTQLRQAGEERVLPGIPVGKRKAGDKVSKWWNERYRARHLPAEFQESRKVLYSFRHTYITQALSVARLKLEWVQQMVGHERKHMGATTHYDGGLSIPDLYQEVGKIRFDDVDLSHLTDGWTKHPMTDQPLRKY